MNYSYRHVIDSAKLYGIWLFFLAGAITNQMLSQLVNPQIVHLKVLS